MNNFVVLPFVCCLISTLAHPGFHGGYGSGGGGQQLQAVPDASHFSNLQYAQNGLIDLGSSSIGSVPPTVVQINTKEQIEIPKPYPIKVPHPFPVPVPVAKPYPVVETKLVHVPVPQPVEIVKKVPVFIPTGGSAGGHQQLSQNDGGDYGFSGGFGGGLGYEHSQADQSAGYQSVSQPEEGWVPSDGGNSQQQEQH